MNPTSLIGKIIRNFAPSYLGAPDLSKLEHGVLPGRVKSQTLQLADEKTQAGGRQFGGTTSAWTYDFLEYIPGFVTVAPLNGALLTGQMSGCYLCKYTIGRQVYIAHVGTDVASEDRTDDVKKK